MQNSLLRALNNTARTENGMRANASTFSKCVDLFFAIGASRGKDMSAPFAAAFAENEDTAVRILQWARDVRGGAGERAVFRILLKNLAAGNDQTRSVAAALLPKVPEIGRWDDLLELFGTPLEADVAFMIAEALTQRNGLAAKWMPRKGPIAAALRRYWGLTPKQYRKLLVTLTNVVETKMCAKDWETIDFGKLPSLASARYQKAFLRNAPSAYGAYKTALEKGVANINAGAVYPYDVIKSLKMGDEVVANAQWNALPNYMQDSGQRILTVADVSGSMGAAVGDNPNLTCIDVCISLAMYIAERSTGSFKNAFITFSENPKLQYLTGKTLGQRYKELARADWGMSTNLIGTFSEILGAAKRGKVPAEDMPTTVLILSDMQFNACARYDDSALQSMQRQYEAAGYEMPKIVFWNLRAAGGNFPATVNDKGVALVSGCSPAILKTVLTGQDFSPAAIMLEAVGVERYNWK